MVYSKSCLSAHFHWFLSFLVVFSIIWKEIELYQKKFFIVVKKIIEYLIHVTYLFTAVLTNDFLDIPWAIVVIDWILLVLLILLLHICPAVRFFWCHHHLLAKDMRSLFLFFFSILLVSLVRIMKISYQEICSSLSFFFHQHYCVDPYSARWNDFGFYDFHFLSHHMATEIFIFWEEKGELVIGSI